MSSPPSSPLSSPAVPWSCLATRQGQMAAGGSSPCRMTQGMGLKLGQAGLGSSCAQLSGTQGTSPIPSCGCRSPASHGVGRAVGSWPSAPGERAQWEAHWAGGAGSGEAARLGGEAAGFGHCFLLGPDMAASTAPAGNGRCCHLAACLQLTVLHRSLPPVAEHRMPVLGGYEVTMRDSAACRGARLPLHPAMSSCRACLPTDAPTSRPWV